MVKEFPPTLSSEISNSTDDINTFDQIQLYPNPVRDYFYLNGVLENAKISIFDLNGKLINTAFYLEGEIINVENLSKGIYILKIENLNKLIITKKLIIN